jgi:hypothetical protein
MSMAKRAIEEEIEAIEKESARLNQTARAAGFPDHESYEAYQHAMDKD